MTAGGSVMQGALMVTDDNVYCRVINIFWGGTFLACSYLWPWR